MLNRLFARKGSCLPLKNGASGYRLRTLSAAAFVAGLLVVGGCANSVPRPVSPDMSALAPAEQAIAEARAVHADELAPAALREAQRRMSQARKILVQAALRGTQPDAAEQLAVNRLVEEARVDALRAQALTQRAAVSNALGEFERALRSEEQSNSPDEAENGPLNNR